MSETQRYNKLMKRVQRNHNQEQSFALGCDRSTISHIVNNGNDITDASKRLVQYKSVHDRYARRWAAKRASHERILIEVSPFCSKCSRKYLKQIRAAECECE